MTIRKLYAKSGLLALVGWCVSTAVFAQQPQSTPPASPEEVVRVSSDLIQTGVGVFDEKGKFVRNLRREDFDLKVDGQSVPISFFEQVSEGTEPLAPQRNREKNVSAASPVLISSAALGRTIIFLADDMHLSFDSMRRTRDSIIKFIEREMRAGDTAAVVSTSGKIGFLQQITDDKTVLRAAVSRLIFNRDYSAADRSSPPMTTYEAQLIDRYDQEVTDVFAAFVIRESPGTTLESAREQVRQRARSVLSLAAIVNRNMYSALEQAVRRTAQIPGRKIVVLFSDGFLLDPTNTDSSYRMRRITDAATRSNAVIYSFDAKGLEAGFPENTSASAPSGGFRVQSGERFETGDGLNELAASTGGRFIRNTNDLSGGIGAALNEASEYYLLAWQPETEGGKPEATKKIEVAVRGRPELKARFHTGYMADSSVSANNSPETKKASTAAADPLAAPLNSPVALRSLPVALAANYLDAPGEGGVVTVALQFEGGALDFAEQAGEKAAKIDAAGVIYNADGERAGYFRELITASVPNAKFDEFGGADVFYNHRAKLKPGLYQVRVAARDLKSGRVGSAQRWVEVPDLSKRRMALSSLLVGSAAKKGDAGAESTGGVEVSVKRRFKRSAEMRYVIFIYNAGNGSRAPDVTVQTRIFRGANPILNAPARRVQTEGQDVASLAYAAELPLNGFAPGSYELVLTIRDAATKQEGERRVKFDVE